jgi:uncharacterized protein YjbI with pentapeptide repeats
MTIRDKSGNVLVALHSGRDLSEQVLRNAQFAGLELEGFCFDSADLAGADFTGSDLYGANLMDARCDDCSFRNADLRGAAFFRASLRRADLRNARLGPNNMLTPSDVSGVDFTDALLEGADFTAASYDTETKFPAGFDPLQRGLHLDS